jgi:hypothetical protein
MPSRVQTNRRFRSRARGSVSGAWAAAPGFEVIWIEPFTTGAFGDDEARRDHVALDDAGRLDLDALGAAHVAGHAADHHHRLRLHLGLDRPVRADRELAVGQRDLALDLALDHEVLFAGEIAVDRDRLADVRHVSLSLALPADAGPGRSRARRAAPLWTAHRTRPPRPPLVLLAEQTHCSRRSGCGGLAAQLYRSGATSATSMLRLRRIVPWAPIERRHRVR